ncbi:MAG: hypothetical protein ACI8UP_002667 [Porticoccaceae bacterium]
MGQILSMRPRNAEYRVNSIGCQAPNNGFANGLLFDSVFP